MTKLFPSQFLKQGGIFKMGYSQTKTGLMKQTRQRQPAQHHRLCYSNYVQPSQRVNNNSMDAGLQNLRKDV